MQDKVSPNEFFRGFRDSNENIELLIEKLKIINKKIDMKNNQYVKLWSAMRKRR